MEEKEKNVLGGFEAVFDSFIPKTENEEELDNLKNIIDNEDNDDKKIDDPVINKMKEDKVIDKKDKDDSIEKESEEATEEEIKRKPGRPKKEDITTGSINVAEPEEEMVVNFYDAIADKLGWEDVNDDEKPKNVEDLINYFSQIIEEQSKPEYASDEMEQLDNFVKQGGDLAKYLTIETQLNFDNIDLDNEDNQKLVVKQLLRAKGFSEKKIEKQIERYYDAGLLEDEAHDALEDLKEIKEQQKQQLLAEQEKAYKAYQQRQLQFYNNVVDEIKNLNNIRGIAIPEKDKRVLIDYILKPDSDGKTKYQKDYAKGGVKNLIESAYFTMNADKLIEAAKREGNNSAINKFKNSLKSSSINSRTRTVRRDDTDDNTIWDSFTKRLRIS